MTTCLPWLIYSLMSHITLLKVILLLWKVTTWSSPKPSTWPTQASVVCPTASSRTCQSTLTFAPLQCPHLWNLHMPFSLPKMYAPRHEHGFLPENSRCPLFSLNLLRQPIYNTGLLEKSWSIFPVFHCKNASWLFRQPNSIQAPYPPIDNTQPASFFFTALRPPEILSIRMKLKANRRFINLLTGTLNT